MRIEFAIRDWSACAPGLYASAEWEAWSRSPSIPADGDLPALRAMPPMLRRRLAPLGQAALGAVYAAGRDELPVVFASRHGDVARAAGMLADVAARQPLSPAAFAMSVHNAIGAMYSIAQGHVTMQQAVSAGRESVEAALVDAAALIADGCAEVLLMYCDAPLPRDYGGFRDEPDALYGWSWRISAPVPGQPRFCLSRLPESGVEVPHAALPHGLDVLRYVLSGDQTLVLPLPDGMCWHWQRHD